MKIPELRSRILFTLALLAVARVGAHIPLPGIDPHPLQNFFASQTGAGSAAIGLYNMFTGGALLRAPSARSASCPTSARRSSFS